MSQRIAACAAATVQLFGWVIATDSKCGFVEALTLFLAHLEPDVSLNHVAFLFFGA